MKLLIGVLALALLPSCASLQLGRQNFTAKPEWVRATAKEMYLGPKRQHRFQPLLTKNLIIQGNALDGIVAYDRKSAGEKWRFKVMGGVEGGGTVHDHSLFFAASDGFLYSVDVRTGAMNWSYPIKVEGLGTPTYHDGAVYFLAGNNVLHAVNAETGKLNWLYSHRDASTLSIRGASQPLIHDGRLYVGLSDGFLVSLRAKDGVVAWEVPLNRNRRFRDIDSEVVIDGDRLYVTGFDAQLYCVNLNDGSVLWTVDEGAYSGVTLVDSTLYYSSSQGAVLAVDRISGKVKWRAALGGIGTRPTVINDMLAVGEMNGALKFLERQGGSRVGEFHPGWGVSSQVTLDSDDSSKIYFMSSGANLFALRVQWKRQNQLWPWETP